jgi:ATP-dependent Clp protease ATP-binding subunit ClpB
MSEFQERHTVSRLIGAPPGYVGYEEGGYLTEAVRRKPYSIVLLDEIEKAHQDVFNVLLQVLDDGRLTDGQGRTIDFKNTVIIMTSNIGSQWITDVAASDYSVMKDRVLEAARSQFKPEFINRVDEMIIFRALTQQDLKRIIDLQLMYLVKRTEEQGVVLEFTERLKETYAKEGYDPVYGARPLKRLLQRKIQDELAMLILKGEIGDGDVVTVDVDDRGNAVFHKKEVKQRAAAS